MFGTDLNDRTEPASPRRLEEARRSGLVPRSRDLTAALVLLAAAACLSWFGPPLADAGRDLLRDAFTTSPASLVVSHDGASLRRSLAAIGEAAGGALLLLILAAVGANVVQFGFRLTPDSVRPAWHRVSISGGLRRLAASAHPAGAGLSLLKLLLVSLITLWTVVDAWPLLTGFPNLSPADVAATWGGLVVRLAWQLSAVLLALSAGDLLYQRRRYELSLRMTPEEAREEALQQQRNSAPQRRQRDALRPLPAPGASGPV